MKRCNFIRLILAALIGGSIAALVACAFDPTAFGYAVGTGIEELSPVAGQIPGAITGEPGSLIALGSYALNAGLAAWATYERRKRKKVENAGQ